MVNRASVSCPVSETMAARLSIKGDPDPQVVRGYAELVIAQGRHGYNQDVEATRHSRYIYALSASERA